jgi:hypothetical protein
VTGYNTLDDAFHASRPLTGFDGPQDDRAERPAFVDNRQRLQKT